MTLVTPFGAEENAGRVDGGLCEADDVLLGMLGPFQLRNGDHRPVEAGGPRVRMLLARLALEANHTVSTEELIDELWGGSQPARALNALQSLVSRARRTLPVVDGLALRSESTGYALVVPTDEIDVHRFERLAGQGHRLLAAGEAAQAAETLRTALELWRGSALVDFGDAPFAEAQAARLHELRLAALEDRIDADLRLGRHVGLSAELDALTARHPLRERFTALRVRTLYACGRQADALAAYDELRRRLADELGVDPSRELRDLHLAVLRGDPRLAPAEPVPAPAPVQEPTSALPVRLSSFVGREAEIDQVTRSLGRTRLVTLFGSGGAGKTRLATESAAVVRDRRVLFVELAPVRDEHDLSSAVLGALGLRETRLLEPRLAITHVRNRLVEALSAGPTLLVLDNCEHVIDAAAEFVDELVSRCPELTVLATSREPLALTGEELLPVGPLGLPETPGESDKAAAVRLFVERAAAVRPAFTLTEGNTADVVEICRRLDGMPLAIELAAARLRAMSVRQVADRLDDRFRLLTGGNRTSMPRHRTLRAVVEWSWELLDGPEQALARRLSVFAGAVRAESVAAVCAGPDLPVGEVVYVLSSLVEKSLIEAVDGERGMRYRMLETVRAYCSERLGEADERESMRLAHAEHFLALAETGGHQVHLGEQLDWLERLGAEHDNILAALHRAIATGDADRAVRFCAALAWYWSMTAQHSEILGRLDAAVAIDGDAPADSRATVELMRGFFANRGEWGEYLRRGAAGVRDTDAMNRYLYVAGMEPVAWLLSGETTEFERSAERAFAHPNPWARAAALYVRSAGAEHRGDITGGEEYARAAAQAFKEVGDRWGVAQTISSQAGFRSLRGDQAGAIEVLGESVEAIRQLCSSDDLAPLLVALGVEKLRAGDLVGARADLEEADSVAKSSLSYHQAVVWGGLAELARYEGDLRQADDHVRRAHESLGESSSAPQPMRQMVLVTEARLRLDQRRLDTAAGLLREGLELGSGIGNMPMTAVLAEQTARWLFASGRPERAAHTLGVAVALRGLLDEGAPEVRALRSGLAVALGSAGYRQSYERGAALSRDDALADLHSTLRGQRTGREGR